MAKKPAPQSVESTDFRGSHEGMSVLELLTALWTSKRFIVLSMIIMGCVGYAYTVFMPKQWSTQAIITSPQLIDYSSFSDQVKQYQPIFDVYQGDGTVKVSAELNDIISSKEVLNEFTTVFNSYANKKQFLEQYKVFIEQINRLDTSDSDEQKLEKLYALWANRLSSKMLPDKSYVLFATSNNAESSYQLLTAYVKFVNLNVRKNLINNLNAVIESKYHELNQYREILIEQSKNKIEIEKEKTKIALQLAIAAGVSEPIESVSSNNLFSFYVGSKALAEKVKILDELKNYNLVEPELQSVEAKLSLISTLGVDKNLSLKAYRYQREPSLPISYAGPGNVIIIVIFILIGVLLSTVFVLIRSAIKMNKTNYVECKSGK